MKTSSFAFTTIYYPYSGDILLDFPLSRRPVVFLVFTFDCRFRHFGLFLFNVQFDFPTSCSGHTIYICIMCDLKISFTWLFIQFLFNKKKSFYSFIHKIKSSYQNVPSSKIQFPLLVPKKIFKYSPLQPPFNSGPQCL